MRQWMAPVWGKLADGGGKIKAAWDNGGLDMLSYAVVLLPPLVVSLLLPDLFFKAADLAGVYGVAVRHSERAGPFEQRTAVERWRIG
jgi:hypothetical protein